MKIDLSDDELKLITEAPYDPDVYTRARAARKLALPVLAERLKVPAVPVGSTQSEAEEEALRETTFLCLGGTAMPSTITN
jgi:hypothetical protein